MTLHDLRKGTGEPRTVRQGSPSKRASILRAARDLFLSQGYERSSVDAVAAEAGVSKRTVYDYFGDKQALLLAVIDQTGLSLITAIRSAIDEHLTQVTDLAQALGAFARQIATDTFFSSDYALLRRLFAAEASHLPELNGHWLADAAEDTLAERFADLARLGLLDAPNPRLAADHFVALTFLLALNNTIPDGADAAARVEQAIGDGIAVFLRAYGTKRATPRHR